MWSSPPERHEARSRQPWRGAPHVDVPAGSALRPSHAPQGPGVHRRGRADAGARHPGSTSAMFSIVNGVLLRGLPFPEPERLVKLGTGSRSACAWRSSRRRSSASWASRRGSGGRSRPRARPCTDAERRRLYGRWRRTDRHRHRAGDEARAEMDTIAAALAREFKENKDKGVALLTLYEDQASRVQCRSCPSRRQADGAAHGGESAPQFPHMSSSYPQFPRLDIACAIVRGTLGSAD